MQCGLAKVLSLVFKIFLQLKIRFEQVSIYVCLFIFHLYVLSNLKWNIIFKYGLGGYLVKYVTCIGWCCKLNNMYRMNWCKEYPTHPMAGSCIWVFTWLMHKS